MKRFLNLSLIENHDQAYFLWKKLRFKHKTLVHIDAHIDFKINHNLDIHNKTKKKYINIGNYIYAALKENMFSDFYWVVPGVKENFSENFMIIKKIIQDLQSMDKNIGRITYSQNILKIKFYQNFLYICSLEELPIIKDKSLLDIDLDFFVANSLKQAGRKDSIGEKKPWISINKFIQTIKKRIINFEYVIISYSVNGGWTPMIYKYLGDCLARSLGYRDRNLYKRILAGELFYKFRCFFEKNQLSTAKKIYKQALTFNPRYDVPDNNYGLLYLLRRNYDNAQKEFETMLEIDENNPHYLMGLGILFLFQEKLVDSRKYFLKALESNRENNLIYIYLAFIEFHLGNFTKAERMLLKYGVKSTFKAFSLYLLGKIYEKKKKTNIFSQKYKIFFQEGLSLKVPFGLDNYPL